MSQTQVQAVSGTSLAAATSVSATLSAATKGNILWCAVGMDKSSGALTPPAGFTTLVSQDSASVSTYVGYKVAAGGETTITLTRATASTAGDTMWVGEYSDTNTGGSWAVLGSASDLTNETTRLVTPSGTTAATVSASGQALAFFTIDSGQSNTGTLSYTNSYTNIRTYAASGKGDVAVAVLANVAAGTAATTSQTHTPTADQTSGVIVVFASVGIVPQQPAPRRRFTLPRRKRNGAASPLPAGTPPVTTQPLPPQARTTNEARPQARPRRRGAQPPFAAAVTVTAQALPPQQGRRRLRPPATPRGSTTLVVTVAQQLPPQAPRRAAKPPPRRRGVTATPVPAGTVTVTTGPLVPQARTSLRVPRWARGKARQAQPVPPQVLVVTAQALPPQPARPARQRWTLRAKPRQAQPIPAQQTQVTTQPLPAQPTPRRRLFQPRTRPRGAQVVITVTAPPPPQAARRAVRPLLRARTKTAQPVRAAPAVTVQILPPQPARRRRPWPWHRYGRGAQYVATPPVVIVTGVPPFTVTSSDRAAATVTSADTAAAGITSTDRASSTVTATDQAAAAVTGTDTATATVTSSTG